MYISVSCVTSGPAELAMQGSPVYGGPAKVKRGTENYKDHRNSGKGSDIESCGSARAKGVTLLISAIEMGLQRFKFFRERELKS